MANGTSSWICMTCAKKYGFMLRNASLWHFATCLKCKLKDAVTEQAKAG